MRHQSVQRLAALDIGEALRGLLDKYDTIADGYYDLGSPRDVVLRQGGRGFKCCWSSDAVKLCHLS